MPLEKRSEVRCIRDWDDSKITKITKHCVGDNADYSAYVMLDGNYVLVKSKNVISYVFYSPNKKEVFNKFYHLVGKLIQKETNSKYFGYPLEYEHCKNGHPGNIHRVVWEQIAAGFDKYIEGAEKEEEENNK